MAREAPPTLEGNGSTDVLQNPSIPTGPQIDFVGVGEAIMNFFGGPFANGFSSFLSGLATILSFLSLFFMLAIIYIVIQRHRVLSEERAQHHPDPETSRAARGGDSEPEDPHPRWSRILEHLEAGNPSDWRVAIIEADNILYELLEAGGYEGDTLGEMLTNANVSPFRTLERAWEAHKIRNQIAHEGDFEFTAREARRVIGLYEAVFREFRYL